MKIADALEVFLRSEFGWMMIVRNAVLLTISIIVTKKIANKSPGAGQKQTNKPIK
ncbi:MAG: hypothetical protein FD188_2943 [Ignavibacteria bacterium]|nr:MAG: hypothetical protein FD188_2943 [Ignavibacteria bacterium]